MANLTEHQCKGKCPEFKKEQCNHCLIAQVEKREFDLGLAPDDAYVKCGEVTPLFVSDLDDVEMYHRRAVVTQGEVS